MKRISYILAAIMLLSSCTMKEFATDTWTCSVELRSSGTGQTTTAGGGICLVKGGKQDFKNPGDAGEGGDELIIEVRSSHDGITVSSCQFELLQGDQLSGAGLGRGASVNISNGVGTITISPALMANNISESKPCTFRITLKDERSGQEREFVKQFYVYKNFWLNIVFKRENAAGTWTDMDDQDEKAVWGLQPFQYDIRSNQEYITIKDFDWEANAFDTRTGERLIAGNRLRLSWNANLGCYSKSFTYARNKIDFPKVTGTEGEGDKENQIFWLEAYNEDFDTSAEERTQITYKRYYNTIVEAKLSCSSSWTDVTTTPNILERNRPAYLLVYCNRNTAVQGSGEEKPTFTDVFSNPDITNPHYKEGSGICWFEKITASGEETGTGDFTNGVACFPINSGNDHLLTDAMNPHPSGKYCYEGELDLTLHTVKPAKEWPIHINYIVKNHEDVGPDRITLSDFKCFDKDGNPLENATFAPDGYRFNEGQYLAARITDIGTADGKVVAILENSDQGGAVDFHFIKSDNLTGEECKDAVYSGFQDAISGKCTVDCSELSGGDYWLVCRGLNRGGVANVRLEGSIPGASGRKASASFSPFVRHIAVISAGVNWENYLVYFGGNSTGETYSYNCGDWYVSHNYGWYSLPTSLTYRVSRFNLTKNYYPAQVDVKNFNYSDDFFENEGVDCFVSFKTKTGFTYPASELFFGKCDEASDAWGNNNEHDQATGHKIRTVCMLNHNKIEGFFGCCGNGMGCYHARYQWSGTAVAAGTPSYTYQHNNYSAANTSGYIWNEDSVGRLRYYCDKCEWHWYNGMFDSHPVWHAPEVTADVSVIPNSVQCSNNDYEVRYFIRNWKLSNHPNVGANYWNDTTDAFQDLR